MSAEKHGKDTITLTRAILGNVIFGSKNAKALILMAIHGVTPEELEDKISGILRYLKETKEDEN